MSALAAAGVSNQSISQSVPGSGGTFYYGACVVSVSWESNTRNNCSGAAPVTVEPSVSHLAPTDQSAFDTLFVDNILSTESHFVYFPSSGRFTEQDRHLGDYTYANTGPNTGTLIQTYDDPATYGGNCTIRITFVSATAGTSSFACADGRNAAQDWRLDTFDRDSFNIEIVWVGSVPGVVENAFQAAVAQWESVITASITPIYLPFVYTVHTLFDNHNTDKIFGVVDDLRIYARVSSIDGEGGTLGRTNRVVLRNSSWLPAIAGVTIDADDMSVSSAGFWTNVVVHEIGHSLGIGSAWSRLDLLDDPYGDPHFNGPNAIAAFDAAGGTGYMGEKVPVEETGGYASHWRGSVFGDEVMGPYRSAWSTRSPLSSITVQAMADMGYSVDATRADPYTLPSSNSSAMRALAAGETPKNWVPHRCVVPRPISAREAALIELPSLGHP